MGRKGRSDALGRSDRPLRPAPPKLGGESDTIGWISIPGTEIDYPVMYTPEDPDFYLNHGFDREPSAGGMIYLDAGDDCLYVYLLGSRKEE